MNSFYNDDLLQRVLILWIMALMVVYGNNAPLVDEEIGAMRSAVGSYMAARLSLTAMHIYNSFASYQHRPQLRLWAGLSVVTLAVYIPLYFESVSMRAKVATTAVAVALEQIAWVFCYSPAAKKLLRIKYSTAVDIPHEADRFAAFYIIALGEFLYLIIVGNHAAIGLNERLLRAIWTLIIAFCLNWLYVHADGSVDSAHPLRHNIYTAFGFAIVHLPLIASLLAGGHLAAASVEEEDFEDAQRWLLCGGLGVGMLCLYAFALMHGSKDEHGALCVEKVCGYRGYSSRVHLLMFCLAGSLDYETDHWDYRHFAASCSPPWSYLYSFHHNGTVCALHRLGECQFSQKWGPFLGALDRDGLPR